MQILKAYYFGFSCPQKPFEAVDGDLVSLHVFFFALCSSEYVIVKLSV